MKKKILAMAMTVILALCSVACTSGSGNGGGGGVVDGITGEYPTAIPSYDMYKDTRRLEHVAFWTPPPTDQHYQWLAESGMTQIVVDAKYNALPVSETMERVLSLCEKYDITAYPVISRDMSGPQREGTFDNYFRYKSFGGFYTDEPIRNTEIDNIVASADNCFGKVGYKYDTFVTLICDVPLNYTNYFKTMEDYYDYFARKMQGKTKKIGFDIYPIKGHGNSSQISSNWLYVNDVAARCASEYGFELYSFLSTMSITSQGARHPDYDDLSYAMWVSLAFGAKGIEYFCYNSPGGPPYNGEFRQKDWAMLYIDDQYYNSQNYVDEVNYDKYYRTETYYKVQQLTQEFGEFDHVMISFDWKGVMVNSGTDAKTSAGDCFTFEQQRGEGVQKFVPLESHKRIKSVTSTEDLIIGTHKEGKYDGFTVVNFADPFYNLSNDVTIEFASATKALVYSKEGKKLVKLESGKFTQTIAAGEGCFVIPIA